MEAYLRADITARECDHRINCSDPRVVDCWVEHDVSHVLESIEKPASCLDIFSEFNDLLQVSYVEEKMSILPLRL
jgi:hypothetical protein